MIRCPLYFCLIYLSLARASADPLNGPNISPVDPGEFPFVASLGRKPPNFLSQREHFCTGVLVSERHVLTAAHCVEGEPQALRGKNKIDVFVGAVDLRTASLRSTAYEVDTWITYREWAATSEKDVEFEDDDVAIVTLSSPVERAAPVNLADSHAEHPRDARATLVGWDLTNEIRPAQVLRKARVRILSREKCEHQLGLIANRLVVLQKNYLCSRAQPHALVDCGDSGGPLLGENNALLGITRSESCATKRGDVTPEFVNQHKVNLHMDIRYYKKFIDDVVRVDESESSSCGFL